jgi:hypothetical protein
MMNMQPNDLNETGLLPQEPQPLRPPSLRKPWLRKPEDAYPGKTQ